MTDQAERTTTTAQPNTSAPNWIGFGGLVLLVVGLLAAVVMWSDMGDDYSSVAKWQAVLSGLLVAGVGLLALAGAAILGRLNRY